MTQLNLVLALLRRGGPWTIDLLTKALRNAGLKAQPLSVSASLRALRARHYRVRCKRVDGVGCYTLARGQ